MSKKQFKAESKRLMELMIHSIYTHKEIFLRELISNASDAEDKLSYRALTDDSITLSREDLCITIVPDKENRLLTISDNGIGMTKDELEANLGTIAKSGSYQFKQDTAGTAAENVDVIGQFGVGFYSAFMVADSLTVISKAYGSDESWMWQSSGVDGYTITACEKETAGTDIIMHLKENDEDNDYDSYLNPNFLQNLIKKYSNYIHYPIRMEMPQQRMKEKPEDAGDDYTPEWETFTEWQTLNSMVPIWQKPKSEVTEAEYHDFYKEKFSDWQDPLATIHTSVEGQVSFKSLLFIPGQTPFDFYTREYEKGLQLYSSGVMIMEKCADLLPDHFRFVKGVVDSQDFSLNISRELLQHDRQLKIIAKNLEKKIKGELSRLQKEQRETYESFWSSFGTQLKYGVVSEYGQHKEILQDLLLFWSSSEGKLSTLEEYKTRMPEGQEFIYYACGESVDKIAALPQVERILEKGYEIFYCTEDVDDFVMRALATLDGKAFKSVSDEDALPQSDDEKKQLQEKNEAEKATLDAVKGALGDEVFAVRLSSILKSAPCCLTADGPVSLEMEKYLSKTESPMPTKAQRVLELNSESAPYLAIKAAAEAGNTEKVSAYAKILYGQAVLLAGLPLEQPAQFTALITDLMK